MCNIMMLRDLEMREMVKKHFTPEHHPQYAARHVEYRLREMGRSREVKFISCRRLVANQCLILARDDQTGAVIIPF